MMFQGEAFVRRYGAEAAEATPPVQAMLDSGLLVAAGTDATRVSSYNPWLALSWLVSGRTVGGLALYPAANRVDRVTALRMYTAAGAELTGEGDVKGTITAGKYGDLAILSADYLTVPENEIAGIESLLTVVGGKVVYAAGEYERIAAPLPAITPEWSPIAHFGGYQRDVSGGVAQARTLVEAVADSEEQRHWRERRGEHVSTMDAVLGCW
jgi:hypothetical protein